MDQDGNEDKDKDMDDGKDEHQDRKHHNFEDKTKD